MLTTAISADHSATWGDRETSKRSCHAAGWRNSESRQGLLAKLIVMSVRVNADVADPDAIGLKCRSCFGFLFNNGIQASACPYD